MQKSARPNLKSASQRTGFGDICGPRHGEMRLTKSKSRRLNLEKQVLESEQSLEGLFRFSFGFNCIVSGS